MTGRATGKAIILGEHFVVHGATALATPVTGVTTEVVISAASTLTITLDGSLSGHAREQALAVVHAGLARVGVDEPVSIRVSSTIPAGYGLGSSAALAVGLVRALYSFRGQNPGADIVREHAHALEGLVHGTPSGLDDTVVALGVPVCFRRGHPPTRVTCARPMRFVLGSVGYSGSTLDAVASVGRLRAERPEWFDTLLLDVHRVFQIGLLAFRTGDATTLGHAMDETHGFLQAVGVSTPELDHLVSAARTAGASGAKLTGAGWGGFMMALASDEAAPSVAVALREAGAVHVLETRV